MKTLFATFFSLLLLLSCRDEKESTTSAHDNEIIGSWLLFEYGYSPGSGYIIEKVPVEPAQIIKFSEDGRFSSTAEEFINFKYYLILEDLQYDQTVLALFVNDPGSAPQDIQKLENAYNLSFEKGLKLSRRWCIEGCHLGFKRIPSTQ